MRNIENKVTHAGYIALKELSNTKIASVQGSTSKGLFLCLPGNQVVFFTADPSVGPITLILNQKLNPIPTGSPVQVYPDFVVFPDSGISIRIDGAIPWKAPLFQIPDYKLLDVHSGSFLETARLLCNTCSTFEDRSPSSSLLTDVIYLIGGPNSSSLSPFLHLIKALLKDLDRFTSSEGSKTQAHSLAQDLEAFLGFGPGLTPSGDDFLSGWLLAFHRWVPAGTYPGFDLDWLDRFIVESAYQKTTTLSANLLKCATKGQVSETLLTAVDGLLSRQLSPAESAFLLSTYGSSSGGDFFCGVITALLPVLKDI